MTLGPILVNGESPIVGPLRVAPINYRDGVNGILHDPTWATRDKDYSAWVETDEPAQDVAFSKTSPFWSFHPFQPANNSDVLVNLEYWNCGELQAEIVSPSPVGTSVGSRAQCVDGNGYLYQHWVQNKTDRTSYSIIRRIKRDGTMIDATIDWETILRAILPVPGGGLPDPYAYVTYQNIPYPQIGNPALYCILPQNDGVLVQGQARYITGFFENRPIVEVRLMWVYVSPAGVVGTPWWQPSANVPGAGLRQAYAYCPAGDGYIGVADGPTSPTIGATGVLFNVDRNGNIMQVRHVPFQVPSVSTSSALNSNVLGSASQTVQIHSNRDIWFVGASYQSGPYLLDVSFNDITPQWIKDINHPIPAFIVSASPILNNEFRFIAIEIEGGIHYHRVRDRFGTILVQAQINPSLGLNDCMYGLRTGLNDFVFEREGPPFGPYGVQNNGLYKFTADNLVCVPVARNRAGCWIRGEFPHLNYLDWLYDD